MHTQLCIVAMAQFIETNRGGKNLHFEGYIYTKIRDGANSLRFWRCQNHKAQQEPHQREAVLLLDGTMITHHANLAQSTTAQAIEGMRKKARDESTSISVIYDDQLEMLSQGENSADVLAQLPSLESIRSSLYRSRHEHTPILPSKFKFVQVHLLSLLCILH